MDKIKRKIFFWTLVFLFFIVAPVVVLEAVGYRFDSSRGFFVHSGSISVKTNPSTVDVFLDESPVSQKLNRINSSANVSGLLPKDYVVKLQSPGFQTWSKKTTVTGGISTEYWNVLMLRENYERTTYDANVAQKFFIGPKNEFLITAENAGESLITRIIDIENKTEENVFTFDGWNLVPEQRQENIEWSPEEDYLSVPVTKTVLKPEVSTKTVRGRKITESSSVATPVFAYFIVDPKTNRTFNLNEFLGIEDIRNVRWDPKNKGYFFFLSGNSLYRGNTSSKDDLRAIAEDVSAFDLSKSDVYFTQSPNELVYKTGLAGDGEKTQLTNSFPGSNPLPAKKLIVYDESRISFIDRNDYLFIFNRGEHETYFKRIGMETRGIQFSDDGKKLLFWTDNEIFVHFLRDWTVQPNRAENETQSITRYSEPLKNVQWFADYEHVVFSAGRYVKIIELDHRNHRTCMDATTTTIDQPVIVYDRFLEKMFFTDTLDGVSKLHVIDLPEPNTILGF